MLRPDDLKDGSLKSGYRHVRKVGGQPSRGGSVVVYQAQHMPLSGDHGPARRTGEEAAQDYCDWANTGGAVSQAKPLRSAGHKASRRRLPDDPEVQAALGVIRDARGAQQGNQGYVYLIVETLWDGSVDLINGAGKIGYSTKPEARVAELQTGNPRRLRLLAYFPGTEADERDAQQRWINHNLLQEWFRLSGPLVLDFYSKEGVVRHY